MTESQVQAFLADAFGTGGLAVARTDYPNWNVADAPTTAITVNAGATVKTITIAALGIDNGTGPDAAILTRIAALADTLSNFDREIAVGKATTVGAYRPGRYRATLIEGGVVNLPPVAWPWLGFGPAGFRRPGDGGSGSFSCRTLQRARGGPAGDRRDRGRRFRDLDPGGRDGLRACPSAAAPGRVELMDSTLASRSSSR